MSLTSSTRSGRRDRYADAFSIAKWGRALLQIPRSSLLNVGKIAGSAASANRSPTKPQSFERNAEGLYRSRP